MTAEEYYPNFFSSCKQQLEPVECNVTGALPTWLKGDLLRAAPGKFDLGDFTFNNWFDGLSIICKFSFEGNNKVLYHSRFLESDAYKKATQLGRPLYAEYATRGYPDPSKSFISKFLSSFDPSSVTDNCYLKIYEMGDNVYVAGDSCYHIRFDRNTLEALEKIDFHKLAGVNMASCHLTEDCDGNFYNIGLSVIGSPKYKIFKTSVSEKSKNVWKNYELVASIPSSWNTVISYIHSFRITDNYFIFLEIPMVINTLKIAMSQVRGKSFRDCLETYPNQMTKVIVVNKITGQVKKTSCYIAEAFYLHHIVNAFEVDEHIVLDVNGNHSLDPLENNDVEALRRVPYQFSKDGGFYKRFIIPLNVDITKIATGEDALQTFDFKTTATAIKEYDRKHGEFLRLNGENLLNDLGISEYDINEVYIRNKPYKYIYGVQVIVTEDYEIAQKLNIVTGEQKKWICNKYEHPCGPLFIAHPEAKEEDDGIILIIVNNSHPQRPNYVQILDAKSFEELCRIEVPVHVDVPLGGHATFLPNQSSNS